MEAGSVNQSALRYLLTTPNRVPTLKSYMLIRASELGATFSWLYTDQSEERWRWAQLHS